MAGGRRIGPDGRHVAGSGPRGTAATSPRGRCRPRVIGRRPGGRAGVGQRVHAGRRLPSTASGKPSGCGSKKPGGTAIALDTRRARLHRQPGHRTYLHGWRVTPAGDCHLSFPHRGGGGKGGPRRHPYRSGHASIIGQRSGQFQRAARSPATPARCPRPCPGHGRVIGISRSFRPPGTPAPALPADLDAPAQSPWRARPSRRGRRGHTGAMRAGCPRGGASGAVRAGASGILPGLAPALSRRLVL